ncbi:MAG: hypothetical protein H0T62_07895 [Parachlamydiaceae bacterium]|nr:hypothetical protein [Parachlamydiaceae bacterium]
MNPISDKQLTPREKDNLIICCTVTPALIIGLVATVAATIFAISAFCIFTYGAPLAIVAFVANPYVSLAIAGAALIILQIAMRCISRSAFG